MESVFYCEVIITCCSLLITALHYCCCRMRHSTIMLGACSSSRPAILISQSDLSTEPWKWQPEVSSWSHSASFSLWFSVTASSLLCSVSSQFLSLLLHSVHLLHSSILLPFFPFPSFYLCSLLSSASPPLSFLPLNSTSTFLSSSPPATPPSVSIP